MILGLFAISFGSLLLVVDPYILLFKWKVKFTEGSEIYELWHNPPVELGIKVYLFNVTNRDEFMSGKDDKLKFQQIGPYAYKEKMHHANVTFNDNGTLTSVPMHPLRWWPEQSNGTEDDIVVMPNIALLAIASLMNDATFFTRMGLNLLIKQTDAQPLVRMTAKEFMFGYKTTLLSLGNKFLPSWIHFDKLGLIDRMYDFTGDTSTVYTGEHDPRLAGLFENYNGLPYLPQWKEAPCNIVRNASDGSKFPSFTSKNDTLYFFRKSLCRAVRMELISEENHRGLKAYRYHFVKGAMDNGHNISSNLCFCRQDHCLPAGLMDVTDCYYGFPIAVSYPHFMDTDESVLDSVEGLKPDPDLHTTFFVVNPISGLPLKISVKTQINMALGDLSMITNTQRFSNMVLPMLWSDIFMDSLPASLITRFFIYLRIAPIFQTVLLYLFLIGGVAFILLSLSSAFLMPKNGQLNDSSGNWKQDAFRHDVLEKEMNKERLRETTKNNKEMEVYYCSLLRSDAEEQGMVLDDSVLQRTLDSLEEIEV